MVKGRKIQVKNSEINIIEKDDNNFISLTDMTVNFNEGSGLIGKWITNKNTLEYLGIWEKINFVYADEADMLNMALFGITAKQWRDKNPDVSGNIRDEATIEQLVVLSNLESINAVLIHQGLSQSERLSQLNKIAITQMKSLLGNKNLRQLK